MDAYERVMELAKRRGFIWSSLELYGGVAGLYDYGPLGAALKHNMESLWRRMYCTEEGFYEIESSILALEDVFLASGHLTSFSDPITTCSTCGESFRADHLLKGLVENTDALSADVLNELLLRHHITCPKCGGQLCEVGEFNLMFRTDIGPGGVRPGYLRPETAQGIFVNYERLYRFFREKLPFGVVQLGRSFRNEISPRQGVIRLREFSQAELELFVLPDEKTHPDFNRFAGVALPMYSRSAQGGGKVEVMTLAQAVQCGVIASELLAYHIGLCWEYLRRAGLDVSRIRFRQHLEDEMAHYAVDCWDAEVQLERFGWVEVVGIADRAAYDLTAHEKLSGKELKAFVEYETPERKKVVQVVPDMSKLGPLLKGRAKLAAEQLSSLSPEQLEEAKQEGYLSVELDGELVKLDPSVVQLKQSDEDVRGEYITPHVIEPSYGIDRILYALMEHSMYEDVVEGERRVVLRLSPKVAPVPFAVLPLMDKPALVELARTITSRMRGVGMRCEYDEGGFIGRRYRRFDEAGTPFCITVDYQSVEDGTVTIRERDSMHQLRAPHQKLEHVMHNLLLGLWSFGEVEQRLEGRAM